MHFKRLSFVLILSLFSLSGVFAQLENFLSISPYIRLEREDKNASITINCNVKGADVFLNGRYQGKTDLVISNLRAGDYRLTVKKAGYETAYHRVTVRSGYDLKFNVHLKLETGYVSVNNLTSDSYFYVDSTRYYSSRAEVPTGYHTVKIRRFGYVDYVQTVYVRAHNTEYVNAEYTEMAFSVQDFELSRSVINPLYMSGIGKTEISFYVTNTHPAIIEIRDSYGLLVTRKEYSGFSTWTQNFTWDGMDDYGNIVEDGVYTVYFSAGDYKFTENVTVNSNLSYNLSGISFYQASTGIGTLPAAFNSSIDFIMPFMMIAPMFNLSGSSEIFMGVPVRLGCIFDFLEHAEIGLASTVFLGDTSEELPCNFNAGFRLTGSTSLGDELYFNYAGLVRFGYSAVELYPSAAVDCGNGFGFGGVLGFESDYLYTAYSVEFALAAKTGDFDSDKSRILKNGIALSFRYSRNSRINAWCALHSAFGVEEAGAVSGSDSVVSSAESGFRLFSGIDTGLELVIMPFTSTLQLNFKVSALFTYEYQTYISSQIALSYLF